MTSERYIGTTLADLPTLPSGATFQVIYPPNRYPPYQGWRLYTYRVSTIKHLATGRKGRTYTVENWRLLTDKEFEEGITP